MKRLICSLIMIVFLVSCAPKPFVPTYDPPDLAFEKTPIHTVDTSQIDKLKENFTPFKVTFMDVDSNPVVNPREATHVLMTIQEFKNFGVAMEMKKAYQQALISEVQITNQYIDVINSLKEYVELERLKAKEYRQLWVDSENAYRQEQYEHKWDNTMNKIIHYSTIGGGIALGILFAL